MERVDSTALVARVKKDDAITIDVHSLRTGRTIRFKTKHKSRGAIWVYENGFIGWLRYVRQKFVIVRGAETEDDMVPVIKAFQWVMDATPAQQAQMEITVYNECVVCGAALTTRREDAAKKCTTCMKGFDLE